MNLLHLGHTIVRLDVVDSTNNYAANWLSRSKVPEGTVIMARSQSQGKGQRGNTWLSVDDMNLTFSVIFYPAFLHLTNIHLLTHISGLAVRETMQQLGIEAHIKWPNDIMVNGRKICGILVENTIHGGRIQNSIVGIGININQTGFPDGFNATSIALETYKNHQPEDIMKMLLPVLEKHYMRLVTGQTDEIRNEYLSHLYMRNVIKRFIFKGEPLEGRISHVNNQGRLVVLTSGGEITADIKEISFQS